MSMIKTNFKPETMKSYVGTQIYLKKYPDRVAEVTTNGKFRMVGGRKQFTLAGICNLIDQKRKGPKSGYRAKDCFVVGKDNVSLRDLVEGKCEAVVAPVVEPVAPKVEAVVEKVKKPRESLLNTNAVKSYIIKCLSNKDDEEGNNHGRTFYALMRYVSRSIHMEVDSKLMNSALHSIFMDPAYNLYKEKGVNSQNKECQLYFLEKVE